MRIDLGVLPHSEEAERAVLASILLAPWTGPGIADILSPGDFYVDRNARIFQSMLSIMESEGVVDARTLQADLEVNGEFERVGGTAYLAGLDLDLPDISRAEVYAGIVKERSIRREIADSAARLAAGVVDKGIPIPSALGGIEKVLEKATEQGTAKRPVLGWKDLGRAFLENRTAFEPRRLSGIPKLDSMISFSPGSLGIIAARPGHGKSSFAREIVRHVVFRRRMPALLFSLEMTQAEVSCGLASAELAIPNQVLRQSRMPADVGERLEAWLSGTKDAPVFVDDTADPSLRHIRSTAQAVARKAGSLPIILIDYLQLMQGRGENRNHELAGITRALKKMAKELDSCIVALSQLSRKPDERGGRPRLSDLRDSGAIEQDPDFVLMVWRPELYRKDERPGQAECIVEKNRGGPTGSTWLRFDGPLTRFTEIDERREPWQGDP